jgi:hypothetical protein
MPDDSIQNDWLDPTAAALALATHGDEHDIRADLAELQALGLVDIEFPDDPKAPPRFRLTREGEREARRGRHA